MIKYLNILSQYAGFINTCFTSKKKNKNKNKINKKKKKKKCKERRQENPAGTFSAQQKQRHGNTPLRNARILVHILFLFFLNNSDRKTPQEHLAHNKRNVTGTPRYVMPGFSCTFCFFFFPQYGVNSVSFHFCFASDFGI